MDVRELQRMYIDHKHSLFTEEFLNEKFNKLHELLTKDGHSKAFFEYVTFFFEDFEKDLHKLKQALSQQNVTYEKAYSHAYMLKSYSFCIGAKRVNNVCITLCDIFNSDIFKEQPDIEELLRGLHEIQEEYALVKNKLERLLGLERQILEEGGSIPKE